ncbi:hypothetical protein TNCV_2850621 [Trichonephila clavipes]|nr:hypothetical protein TNCV_2850621 [Trichonephila clavipes]
MLRFAMIEECLRGWKRGGDSPLLGWENNMLIRPLLRKGRRRLCKMGLNGRSHNARVGIKSDMPTGIYVANSILEEPFDRILSCLEFPECG